MKVFLYGKQMTFGDGDRMFYPLTSLGVTAHEISHGFTETHSNIDHSIPEMGALHESFSDMASAAVENCLMRVAFIKVGIETSDCAIK